MNASPFVNITVCHMGFSKFLKRDKLKRYVLDWFQQLLLSRGIEPHQVLTASMDIGISPECSCTNIAEMGRCQSAIRTWASTVFNVNITVKLETVPSQDQALDIRFTAWYSDRC